MYSYSQKSLDTLATCHVPLQRIFKKVIEVCDTTIITGHRDAQMQDEAYRTGHSKVQWPNSKHNSLPSLAVDAAPYPIDWNDRERFSLFAGLVMGIASEMGYLVRWGGDWDMDWRVRDNSFDDLVHFELVLPND